MYFQFIHISTKIKNTILFTIASFFFLIMANTTWAITTIGDGITTDGNFVVNTDKFFVDATNGWVGIGTNNPGPHPGEGAPEPVPLHVKDPNLGRIYLEGNGSIPSQVKLLHTDTGRWFSWDYDRRFGNLSGIYFWQWDGSNFINMASFKEDRSITFGDRWFSVDRTKEVDVRVNSSFPAFTIYQAGSGNVFNVLSGNKGSNTSRLMVSSSGNVGVGTTSPEAKLEVNGGIRFNTVTEKPTCDSTTRGTTWFAQGSSGVKDSFEVCAKDAGDSYAWRTLY